MTETARLAHYVLPAATQFEKAEATFFNFEFPRQRTSTCAAASSRRPPGTLPEAEIHARLVRGARRGHRGRPRAAARGRRRRARRLRAGVLARVHARSAARPRMAPVILYRTLDLPDELREGAVRARPRAARPRWSTGRRSRAPASPARRSRPRARCSTRSSTARPASCSRSTSGPTCSARIATPDRQDPRSRCPICSPSSAALLASPPPPRDAAFPFVLSAGERRSFTANTIIRDPAWRKKDAARRAAHQPRRREPRSASPPASRSALTTRRGSVVVAGRGLRHDAARPRLAAERPRPRLPDGAGERTTGVAPNELTSTEDRDPFVGTPWHKHVPARVERVD